MKLVVNHTKGQFSLVCSQASHFIDVDSLGHPGVFEEVLAKAFDVTITNTKLGGFHHGFTDFVRKDFLTLGQLLVKYFKFGEEEVREDFMSKYMLPEHQLNNILMDRNFTEPATYLEDIADYIGISTHALHTFLGKHRYAVAQGATAPTPIGHGDKIVLGNTLKTTLSKINKDDADVEVLFSHKSLMARHPDFDENGVRVSRTLCSEEEMAYANVKAKLVPEKEPEPVVIETPIVDPVVIPKELLERLIDIVFDSYPSSSVADKAQQYVDTAEAKMPNPFDDQFLADVLKGERDRQAQIVTTWCEQNGYEIKYKGEIE